MKRPRCLAIGCGILASLFGSTLMAQDKAKAPSYQGEVLAVFNARCNSCHNPDKKKGGLVLDNYAALMQGGASGKVIEPGDPDNSRLYLLTAHEETPEMPPNSAKIPDAEIALIRAWIEAGSPESAGGGGAPVKAKPKAEFKLDPDKIGKPAGEPAMPEGLTIEPVVTSPRPNAITALAHSPWAPLAAVAGYKQVLLYNTQTTQLVGVLPFQEGTVEVLRFTLDGEMLLAGGGHGGQSGRVVVWNVKTGERLFEIGKEYDTVLAADISPNRELVALGGPSKVLRVYNTADGSLAYESKKHTDWVTAIGFSPDGVLLSSGDRNGGLEVWEATTGREFHDLRGHTAMITDLAWRLDSNVVASASEDGSVRLWEMQNGKQIKSVAAHGGGAESVRFAKDGRLVSTGRDRLVKLWKPNGDAEKQLEAFSEVATNAVFTQDDASAIAGDYSGEVRIYELAKGQRIGQLSANPAPVATRLEAAQASREQALSEAGQARAELAGINQQVETADQQLAAAAQGVEQAQQAESQATAARSQGEAGMAPLHAAEHEAGKAVAEAEAAQRRAQQLRQKGIEELRHRSEASRRAAAVFAGSKDEKDRLIAEQARQAVSALSKELEARVPEWNALIEAAASARLAKDQHTSRRIVAEIRLPELRENQTAAQQALATAQSHLEAVRASREQLAKPLADAAAKLQTIEARVEAIQREIDHLSQELNRPVADARTAGNSVATAP